MKLVRGGLDRLRSYFESIKNSSSVLAIGNFDGVHIGHQAIIEQVKRRANDKSLSPQVLTFEPLPKEHFAKLGQAVQPCRIMGWRDKYALLRTMGIDQMNLVKFDSTFALLSPQAFVNSVLVDLFNVQHLIVGEDFKFGADRSGDLSFLIKEGRERGFSVETAKTVPAQCQDKRVSSTWIRECLTEGKLESAQSLLGRPYELSGTVVRGNQIGRTWGVPTANIKLGMSNPALKGVFAVSVTLEAFNSIVELSEDRPIMDYPAVANLGVKPTLSAKQASLEVHLFDYEGDLYGKRLTVRFCKKLRNEKKFDNTQALIAAIRRDYQVARDYWRLKP